MRLRFPIPVAVLAGVVGLGAISIAAAQGPQLQPAANPQVAYTVALTGAEEVPGPGDPDGAGQAALTINGTTGAVCLNLTTTAIAPIVNLHIHTGALGIEGPVLVNFAETAGTNTAVAKCVTTTPVIAASIIANPAGFYVNAHTAAFTAGAVRGQLAVRALGPAEVRLLDEPQRAYDSRQGTDGKLVAGTPRVVDLSAAPSSVPITARAAIITVTVTQTNGDGFATVYSNALTVAPATSTVNWTAPNSNVAATTTVAIDGNGRIAVLAGQNGTHVIVDVIGYYL